MMNRKIFTRIPMHSADSTNVARNSGNRKAHGITRGEYADNIAMKFEHLESAPRWIHTRQTKLFT